MLLSEPPTTRYDLRFSIAGIPVRVHPLFWLMGFLLGATGGDLVFLIIWIAAVFLSILIHELGHAFAHRAFGQPARIVLHLMGGLTIPEATPWMGRWANVSLGPAQEIIVSLAGPGIGFLFAGLVIAAAAAAGGTVYSAKLFGLLPMPQAFFPMAGRALNQALLSLIWINFFWGLVNLLPVYPLDGGSVARELLLQIDPGEGLRKSQWLSVIVGAITAIGGILLLRSFYVALLFGALAFESYQQLRGRFW